MLPDWLQEERDTDSVRLSIRQRRFGALNRSMMAVGFALLAFALIGVAMGGESDGGSVGFVLVLLIVGGLTGLVGAFSLLVAVPVALFTPSSAHLGISQKGISVLGRDGVPKREFPFDEVGRVYFKTSQNVEARSSGTVVVGGGIHAVGAAATSQAAQGIGQSAAALAAANSATVGLNHRGKEVVLAKRLSDGEAEYLFDHIISLTPLEHM